MGVIGVMRLWYDNNEDNNVYLQWLSTHFMPHSAYFIQVHCSLEFTMANVYDKSVWKISQYAESAVLVPSRMPHWYEEPSWY